MSKHKHHRLYDLALEFTRETEINRLFEIILKEAMTISRADKGVMYIHDVDMLYRHGLICRSKNIEKYNHKGHLNDKAKPIDSNNVLGRVVLNKKAEYSDNYLVIPVFDEENDCVSVMELSDPMDSEGQLNIFDEDDIKGVEALASFAGVLFNNKKLVHERGELLHSFVRVMVGAVDTRSPYNAHHTKNMVYYGERFLEWCDDNGTSFLKAKNKDAFLMSIWLHDIGKLLIPLEVMDKATRLGAGLKDVLHRISIGILMEKLEGTYEKIMELEIARDFILEINQSGSLTDEHKKKLKEISTLKCMDEEGIDIPLITKRELESLSVKRGNLTDKERHKIQDHVIYTRYMLDGMNFTGRYKVVPKIAGDHHELLDGSGYPNNLKGKEIKKETRLLTILDIYDALTAEDRPYKPPVAPDKAFEILFGMAKDGKLDKSILNLFMESRAWER